MEDKEMVRVVLMMMKKKGGVTPEGWDVWVGNHDRLQMKASISDEDNCISRLCNDWSRAA